MKTKLIPACTLLLSLYTSATVSAQNTFPATGNVGIGTASPVERLDVVGNIKINEQTLYFRGGSDNNHGVGYRGINPFAGQFIDGPVLFGWNGGGLGSTNSSAGGQKLALRWNEKGYIGINTVNPQEALQIGDRFTFHNGGFKGMVYNFTYNAGDKRLVADFASGIFLTNSGSILLRTAVNGAAGSTISWLNAMTINNDGKVIIGTVAAPGNYSLYAEKGVLTERVKVAIASTANWADHVFEENYKLKSLYEVEAFVKANKHLPNFPSAKEVVKEGIDMASMDAKLLEKIEELTLYLIGMKKENEAQKARIAEMEAKISRLSK